MENVTVIGIDLTKSVFQLHRAAADGSGVFRKKLSRGKFQLLMERHPRCGVAMEACTSAHHWGRMMEALGYEVPLIPSVMPFVKRQKMGWLPPSPDGIEMRQSRGVQSHKKERTANERYNDRGRPGKERFPTSRRYDDGTPAISKEADSAAISTVHVEPSLQCGRDGSLR